MGQRNHWTRRVFVLGGPETNGISTHKKIGFIPLFHTQTERQTHTHTLQEVSFRHKLRKKYKSLRRR